MIFFKRRQGTVLCLPVENTEGDTEPSPVSKEWMEVAVYESRTGKCSSSGHREEEF